MTKESQTPAPDNDESQVCQHCGIKGSKADVLSPGPQHGKDCLHQQTHSAPAARDGEEHDDLLHQLQSAIRSNSNLHRLSSSRSSPPSSAQSSTRIHLIRTDSNCGSPSPPRSPGSHVQLERQLSMPSISGSPVEAPVFNEFSTDETQFSTDDPDAYLPELPHRSSVVHLTSMLHMSDSQIQAQTSKIANSYLR